MEVYFKLENRTKLIVDRVSFKVGLLRWARSQRDNSVQFNSYK